MGLAFDQWDLDYYYDLFVNDMKRNPTNVELFDIAQVSALPLPLRSVGDSEKHMVILPTARPALFVSSTTAAMSTALC